MKTIKLGLVKINFVQTNGWDIFPFIRLVIFTEPLEAFVSIGAFCFQVHISV